MKHTKKLIVAVIAVVAAFALCVPALAFAQQEPADATIDNTKATITINNAAKGETYTVYKIFDATVTGDEGGSIAYTGEIPSALSAYFETIGTTGYVQKKAGATDQQILSAIQDNASSFTQVAQAVSDGSALNFVNLDFGYYVVVTTHKDSAQAKSLVTVNSTNPNASLYDKNETVPLVPEDGKKVNNKNVKIGETLTYTLTFNTSNYEGSGADAKQILSYIVEDTLPDFLSHVTVTEITIDDQPYTVDGATPQFDNKKITIPWVNEGQSLYSNGAVVKVTYTAVVTTNAAIAGNGNTNTFTMRYTTDEGEKTPDQSTDSETVKTYAIAIKKVDDKGTPLPGAKFQFPFAVQTVNGEYYVDASAATQSAELTTPDDGVIVIKGVSSGTYEVTETAAPNGYNKLAGPVSVPAQATSETTTSVTKYIDADGIIVDTQTDVAVTYTNQNVAASATFVVNKTGIALPSTGGMGTTILYIVGGIMIVVAAVFLVGRRRASKDKDSEDQM